VRVTRDTAFLTLLLEPGEVEGLWGEPSYGAGRDTALPTRSIIRLTAINRPQGILDGVLLGAGIGVTSGAIVGLAAEDGWFPAEARAVMGGIVFGVLGIGVGLVVGVLVGARDVYEIAGE
jgi:hypothetical protein